MIDYPAARAVAMVVQTGSFDQAARALHVTPSAISQRVKLLEDRLGVILIDRGPPCTATEKGAWLCRHMEHVGMLEQDLMAHLPGLGDPLAPEQSVTLHIASNADSLGTWFIPALSACAETSAYLFNIALDDQDHTADWLRQGRVIAAVTSLAKPVQGCEVMPLGLLRYHATASPAFMDRYFPDGVTVQAISRAPALTFNQKDQLQQMWVRQVFGKTVPYPTHWLPSTHAFVDGALGGLGWGLNPLPLVAPLIDQGRLVPLIADQGLDVPLYWQINRLAAGPLSALTKTIVNTARRVLCPASDA